MGADDDPLPPPIPVPSPRPPSLGLRRGQQPLAQQPNQDQPPPQQQTQPSPPQQQQQQQSQSREEEGKDALLRDTVAAVQELYRTILESATEGSSVATASANLCLRDLCRDTLAFVAASSSQPGGERTTNNGQRGPSSSSSENRHADVSRPQPMQQQQRQDGPAAAEPDGKPVAFASPPASPRLSGDGDGEGETTNERSPLKGSRARRSSSGNNTDAPGGANGGGDRVSSLRLRRSLLDALLPLPGGGGGGVEDGESGPQVTLLPGPWDAGAAPIVDIGAVFGSDPVPDGFARVSATPYGRRADLNAGAGGHYIYLTLRRDATRRRPPVVALALIFPDRQEFVPPTFSVVRRRGEPVDFNAGTHGERVYLCFKRGTGNPITDVQVLFPRKKEAVPAGYTLLERTPFKYEANLNAGGASRSTAIFLCYRQQLWSVERLLRPGAAPAPAGQQQQGTWGRGLGGEAVAAVAASLAATTKAGPGKKDVWGHTLPPAVPPPQQQQEEPLPPPPSLRRAALAPLLAALYAGTAEVAAAALRELLALAGRYLGPAASFPTSSSNGGEPPAPASAAWLQAALVEALCFFLHRAEAEHFDAVVQFLRAVVLAPVPHQQQQQQPEVPPATTGREADLPCETLQQVFTACVFLCHFEAFRALEAERHLQQAAAAVAAASMIAATSTSSLPLGGRQSLSIAGGGAGGGGRDPPALGIDCSAFATLRQLIDVCLRRVEAAGEERARAAAAAAQQRAQRQPEEAAAPAGAGKPLTAQSLATDYFISSERGRSSAASSPLVPAPTTGSGTGNGRAATGEGGVEEMVRALVVDMVDGATEYVELTKATQRAVDCIKRGSGAASYESLWRELAGVGRLITSCPAEENAFLLLAATCKVASEPPRMSGATGELVERDMAAKLLALELLQLLLKKGGERFQASPLFGCQVRRLVVSALLANVVTGLHDLRVLRRVLALVTLLWRLYRRWCKVECGLLCEEAMLKLLRLVPSLSLIPRQACVVAELQAWLEAFPSGLVELYLNYDLDRKALAVQQPLSAFEELVAALCSLGEDLGSHLVAHEEDPDTRGLHLRTLAAAAALTRALMNASGHAHLISRDAKVRAISLNQQLGGGWEPDVVYPAAGGGGSGGSTPPLPPLEAEGVLLAVPPPIAIPPPASAPASLPYPTAAAPVPKLPTDEKEEEEDVEMWDEGGGEDAYLLSSGPSSNPQPSRRGGGGRGAGAAAGSSRRRRLLSGDGLPPSSSTTSGTISPRRGSGGAGGGSGGGSNTQAAATTVASLSRPASLSQAITVPSGGGGGGGGGGTMEPPLSPRQASSVRLRQEQQQRQDETLTQALALYRAKGLKKAVQYLVASGFMADTPRDVASFLRVYRDLLDPEAIGDFLGEGGNVHDAAYWHLVRLSYVRAVSFHNLTLEQALRHFLTRCGFRLPGEAQKIDRLISVFAECYFQDNQGMPCCPFSQPDTPYILSYAIIILQTDLHKVGRGQGAGARGKLNKPMSKEAFINNLRGVDESPDLTRQYLSEIYDSILARPIEMNMAPPPLPASAAADHARPGHGGHGPYHHHHHHPASSINAAATNGATLRRGGFLSRLLPSAVAAAGALSGQDDGSETGGIGGGGIGGGGLGGGGGGLGAGAGGMGLPAHLHQDDPLYQACREMAQSVRDAEELLRGLAVYPSRFLFVGVNASLTPDLVKLMVERCFFPVHSLCHAVLHNASQMGDPEAVLLALDIAQYAISAALFLGLKAQRQAFATLLVRFKAEQERAAFWPNGAGSSATSTTTTGSSSGGKGPGGAGTGGGGGGGAWAAIGQVHALIADLKDSVQQSRLREELKAVAKRIEARAKLLEGPRRFIREGDLVKKCRSGKHVTYRFFLFSDQLLYCHRGFGGEYKVHQQLLLSLTKVSNVDDRRNCSFQVHHPKKSFAVAAESPEMKRVWLRDINEARAAGRKTAERETQLGVIARLKLESNRVMALLEGKAPDAGAGGEGPTRPASGEAGLLGSPERGGRGFGFGGASSLDMSGGPQQAQAQAQALRARGAGSNVSVSLSSAAAGDATTPGAGAAAGQPASERLQDVELELAFADGLRALQRLLRPPPPAVPSAVGQGRGQGAGAPVPVLVPLQSPPPGVPAASVVVDTKALAGLIGLFLQYRDGDYSHHDHHPLAAVAALSSGGTPEDDPLPALVAAGQQAWKAHAGLSQTAAMNQFLHVLQGAAPGWREGAVSLLSPLSVAPTGVGDEGGLGASGMGKGGKTPRGGARK